FPSPIPVQSVSSDAFMPGAQQRSSANSKSGTPGDSRGAVEEVRTTAVGTRGWPGQAGDFGGNNARLYNFKPQQRAALEGDRLAQYKELYEKHGAGRTNLAYGYALKTV